MKVYCEDCEYYSEAYHSITFGYTPHRCYHKENHRIDEEKNKKYPKKIQGIYDYSDYLKDIMLFDRPPYEINKNNDCKWFEVSKCKWWQWQKRKRLESRYEMC